MRKGKTLWTENAVGDKIEVHTSDSERDEAHLLQKLYLTVLPTAENSLILQFFTE